MKRAVEKLRPANGFSRVVYWAMSMLLPVLALVFVKWSILSLAYGVVLLSKWRILAIRPRHWPASIRANAIDILAGLSFVAFMAQSPSGVWQIFWLVVYEVWLLAIKPRSKIFWISVQAAIGQFVGLVALYLLWGGSSLVVLVLSTAFICYLSARHFFSSFDEPLGPMLAHIWGYIAAAMTWVLGHWLLYYGFLSQPVLILSVLSYGLASLYYLENLDRLSTGRRREIMFVMLVFIAVVVIFSSWGDKTV